MNREDMNGDLLNVLVECESFSPNKDKKIILYKSLNNLLHSELDGRYKISKGYVIYNDKISPLMDLIVYSGNEIYKNDEFAIIESHQIKAIFTLIDKFKIDKFYSIIANLCKIKAQINHNIFAGIVCYPCENLSVDDFVGFKDRFEQKLQRIFTKYKSFVDCASFSKVWFMRKEHSDEPSAECSDVHFIEFYNLNLPYIPSVSSYKYLLGNLKKHLELSADDCFSHPDGKGESEAVRIILAKTLKDKI
ncbi:hypothetical protein ACWIUD_00790 [Helicobacter sp. 23-1044]